QVQCATNPSKSGVRHSSLRNDGVIRILPCMHRPPLPRDARAGGFGSFPRQRLYAQASPFQHRLREKASPR
ncbi:hypothetical protein, partial [Eggerthella lenta]|uniref:hypothetical protein n=1 Tax=Eggerthella lenta TaxID=84112 RepID=UPI00210D6C8E